MQKQLKKANSPIIFVGVIGIVIAGYFSVSTNAEWQIESPQGAVAESQEGVETVAPGNELIKPDPSVTYLKTPDPLYAIYMSQCVVGTPSFRAKLVALIESTALNAVVIDVKDYSGTLGFETGDPRFADAEMVSCGARDMKEFLKTLKEKGIYTIARITVFQDPFYTKKYPAQAVQSVSRPGKPWKDHKGLAFVDVSSREYWEYISAFAKATRAVGFDELNFDYIRYPSDGPMSDAQYQNPNKAEALEKFFAYLYNEIKPTGAVMSADLFGMTTTNTDDLNIGQQLERALPYFDYIAPMVYPSHYPKGFLGLTNPNYDPYRVVNYSMAEAVKRTIANSTPVKTLSGKPIMKEEIVPATAETATTTRSVPSGFYTKNVYPASALRPWLQDFDYGKEYTPEDIERQIQATYDAGLTSWFFWDPANRYDSLSSYLRNKL